MSVAARMWCMTDSMSDAQQAQQRNRDRGGQYAEQPLQDPGQIGLEQGAPEIEADAPEDQWSAYPEGVQFEPAPFRQTLARRNRASYANNGACLESPQDWRPASPSDVQVGDVIRVQSCRVDNDGWGVLEYEGQVANVEPGHWFGFHPGSPIRTWDGMGAPIITFMDGSRVQAEWPDNILVKQAPGQDNEPLWTAAQHKADLNRTIKIAKRWRRYTDKHDAAAMKDAEETVHAAEARLAALKADPDRFVAEANSRHVEDLAKRPECQHPTLFYDAQGVQRCTECRRRHPGIPDAIPASDDRALIPPGAAPLRLPRAQP